MSKTTIYTNVMLTVIAALLCILAFNSTRKSPDSASARIQDVNIVGASKSVPVALDYAASRGAPLEVTVTGTSRVSLSLPPSGDGPLGPLDVRLVGSTAICRLVTNQP